MLKSEIAADETALFNVTSNVFPAFCVTVDSLVVSSTGVTGATALTTTLGVSIFFICKMCKNRLYVRLIYDIKECTESITKRIAVGSQPMMNWNFRYFLEVVHTGNTSMEESRLIALEIIGITVTVISIIVTVISIIQNFRHEKSRVFRNTLLNII